MLDAFFVTIKPDRRQGLIVGAVFSSTQIPLQPVLLTV